MVRTRFNFSKKSFFFFVYINFYFFYINKDEILLYKSYKHDFFTLVFFLNFYIKRYVFRNIHTPFFNNLICKKIIFLNKTIYNYIRF